ncbi:hypothetical protein FOCG_18600 [Fusarium oxysporum f. sp. radicis-lycopersici 26381]|nr:hypothetical protein FOCG_18600 [Fusarium oxysporum f. sp. radicis-lycopersici 26381]
MSLPGTVQRSIGEVGIRIRTNTGMSLLSVCLHAFATNFELYSHPIPQLLYLMFCDLSNHHHQLDNDVPSYAERYRRPEWRGPSKPKTRTAIPKAPRVISKSSPPHSYN